MILSNFASEIKGNVTVGQVLIVTPETQVLSMVRLMTTATNWSEFNAFPKDERLKTIKQLLQNGASIRQMEKLTGIGRGVIQNL